MNRISVFALAILLLAISCNKETAPTTSSALEVRIDSLVRPFIDSAKAAGIAVGVFKGNEKLFLKSYGYADLDFDVKLPVDASFQIGSVTKQFTGAAIMQLAEQNKLNLEDDITKYISFNTKGKKVTIRQLLSHTSGIKGYTELPFFFSDLSMKKYKRDTLLRLVEKESFDFEPGDALIYSNTGFFMLGLIIEKVSGMSYQDYVKKNLFEKAGMANSYYSDEVAIVKNRAHGYDLGENRLVLAMYLNHTWPYAAGSLSSSVEELMKWNQALHHGKILTEQSYKEFITPVSLNDGTVTHYAKGITVTNKNNRNLLAHGGGINGFLSQNSFYPKEDISVIVLINTTGPANPSMIAEAIANMVLTKPSKKNVAKYDGDFTKLAGKYVGRGRGLDLTANVKVTESSLSITIGDQKPKKLDYAEDNSWTDGMATYYFDASGDAFDQLRIDQTYGYLILKRSK